MASPNLFKMTESEYSSFVTQRYLSELIGVILGDFKMLLSILILLSLSGFLCYQAWKMNIDDFTYDELPESAMVEEDSNKDNIEMKDI
ncbi:unnamed protein product [Moneuplotes crassus]|uniref:Uncharacterized protein n=1 Tax=Euplotes crassus TaxID=5936 RepID=A0AAD1YB29_EUPCR|nr:unnamed protein product [Moneuplotes crassus]